MVHDTLFIGRVICPDRILDRGAVVCREGKITAVLDAPPANIAAGAVVTVITVNVTDNVTVIFSRILRL